MLVNDRFMATKWRACVLEWEIQTDLLLDGLQDLKSPDLQIYKVREPKMKCVYEL